MVYKELHMHRAFIDGKELEVAFEGLSDKEKQVAALGEEALAMFISELDRELWFRKVALSDLFLVDFYYNFSNSALLSDWKQSFSSSF